MRFLVLLVSLAGGLGHQVRFSTSPERSRCASEDGYELIDVDTLFYVDNRGLTRLYVNLNGYRFKLTTSEDEVHQSRNAFHIPRFGEITFSISNYIFAGEENCMEILSQGPPGADAEIVVADLLMPGQHIAFVVTDLTPLPAAFALLGSYPNPFTTVATIRYEIPEDRIAGLDVRLEVYAADGRRVRVLVDDRRFPGAFDVTWDGLSDAGIPLPSGVYFCTISAGGLRETASIVKVR